MSLIPLIVWAIALDVFMIYSAARLAEERGCDAFAWGALAFLVGPFAVLVIGLSRPTSSPTAAVPRGPTAAIRAPTREGRGHTVAEAFVVAYDDEIRAAVEAAWTHPDPPQFAHGFQSDSLKRGSFYIVVGASGTLLLERQGTSWVTAAQWAPTDLFAFEVNRYGVLLPLKGKMRRFVVDGDLPGVPESFERAVEAFSSIGS